MFRRFYRVRKSAAAIIAIIVLLGTLFTSFISIESASQYAYAENSGTKDGDVPVFGEEENAGNVTDDVYGESGLPDPPVPQEMEFPVADALASSFAKLIEDFEDISDIQVSEIRTVPGSTKLERNVRPGPVKYGHASGKLIYDFTGTSGTSAAYMNFKDAGGAQGRLLEGYPKKIGAWVYGDGNNHWLRGQLQDAAGTKPTLDFTNSGAFNWVGWKYVTASVPSGLQTPIKLNQIYIVEASDNNKNGGTVYFDQVSAIYTSSDPANVEITGLRQMRAGDSLQAKVFATNSGSTDVQDVTAGTTFTSSSAEIASVDETGLVQAVAGGMTTITAQYGVWEAVYELTVGDAAAEIAAIELEGSTGLDVGSQERVKALAFYEGSSEPSAIESGVEFSSSKPEVAAIANDGVVTALSEGETIIAASYEGKSFSYTLTVVKPVPVLQSIRIADLAPMTVGEEKQARVLATYTLLTEEQDVTETAAFQSSDPGVAEVSASGLVTAKAAGTAKIRATFEGKLVDYLLIVHSPQSQPPKRELRAAWIASVENIDWPQRGVTTAEQQKKDFVALLDELEATGINAVIVQIKPTADAFYPSDYGPWSEWLTGVQGKDPGYDPLAFMLEEAHKRNMEFHAWFNPYRISMHNDKDKLVANHPAKLHPDWVEEYGGKLYYNPGVPEARDFFIGSVMEVVDRYDIDAVHFDDYFYPYPVTGVDFPDEEEFRKYGAGFAKKEDWRRNNVDTLIETLSHKIKASKPYVQFGISPFGIWRNKGTDPAGSDTNGLQSYDALYADTKKWVEEEWLDYIAPQIYWHFGNGPAAYEKVLDWWKKVTEGSDVHLYIGQAVYRVNEWSDPEELANQVTYNRNFASAVGGSMFFSAKDVLSNPRGMKDRLASDFYRYPALPPALTWLDNEAPSAPVLKFAGSARADGVELRWEDASQNEDAAYYAIYRHEGKDAPDMSDPAQLLTTVRKTQGEAQQSYVDRTALRGQAYTYVVTAVDRVHNESAPSNAMTADSEGPGNLLTEKIMAKNAADRTLELEYAGVLRLADNLTVEQDLDGRIVQRTLNEVMVGANNADIHLNGSGEIAKIVLNGETPRDRMRVGIRYDIADITDMTQLNHNRIEIRSDQPFRLTDKIGGKQFDIARNAAIALTAADGRIRIEQNGEELYRTTNRIYVAPSHASSLLEISSLKRAHGVPKYRGEFEVFLSPEPGRLRLINEVGIEQYLYQVVPSEMPASFGLEALKAQAVAARTYALSDYFISRFADEGFHIDDSTLSQVYNNQAENSLTHQAVDETAGKIMLSGGLLVDARFYSTSGGYGASKHEVWSDAETQRFPGTAVPYLTARSYTYDPNNSGSMLEIDTADEQAVAAFYRDLSLTGYDSDSLYFRWKVGLSRAELEKTISKNIKLRHAADPNFILTKQADGSFANLPIPDEGIGTLQNLVVAKRGAGGNMTELIVEGSTGTYKLVKEFNIRFTIRPNKTDTGSETDILAYRAKGGSSDYDLAQTLKNPSILYSAFFTFDIEKGEAGDIERVTFYGGGNGHGVGMSQYGAQMLAKEGWAYDRILNAYYADMSIADLDAPVVTSLSIAGAGELPVGGKDQVRVYGKYSNGDTAELKAGIGFLSSDDSVAAVDEQGAVTARAAGETVITATVGNLTADYRLVVKRASTGPGSGGGGGGGGSVTSPVGEKKPDDKKPEEPDGGGEEPGRKPGEKPAPAVQLTDISEHWAKDAILRAVELGFVTGYEDGTFRPQGQVTRAEFVTMLMRALAQADLAAGAGGEIDFADSASIPAWARSFVMQAVEAGIVTGYDDNTFRPKQRISRAEIAAMAVRAVSLQPDPDAALTFADADSAPKWSRGYIAAAAEAGLMKGRGGNSFAPNDFTTRAEAVVLILALLDYENH